MLQLLILCKGYVVYNKQLTLIKMAVVTCYSYIEICQKTKLKVWGETYHAFSFFPQTL